MPKSVVGKRQKRRDNAIHVDPSDLLLFPFGLITSVFLGIHFYPDLPSKVFIFSRSPQSHDVFRNHVTARRPYGGPSLLNSKWHLFPFIRNVAWGFALNKALCSPAPVKTAPGQHIRCLAWPRACCGGMFPHIMFHAFPRRFADGYNTDIEILGCFSNTLCFFSQLDSVD